MNCIACGSKVPAGARFCPSCGAGLGPVCSMCGEMLPSGARFCPSCGAKVSTQQRSIPGRVLEGLRLGRKTAGLGASGARLAEGASASASPGRDPDSGSRGESDRETGSFVGSGGQGRQSAEPAKAVASVGTLAMGRDERRLVTVLFADITGFTKLSETHDPEQVKAAVDELLRMLAEVVETYGGRVDKFIGDSLMAVFGAPSAHEDDTERAARAALAMRNAVVAFNERQRRRGSFELDLRIGVNSGEVMAGVVGGEGAAEYTVIGDPVNVAARLQQAANPGEILVGEQARELCSPMLRFGKQRRIPAKGKTQPVIAYPLEAALGPPVPMGRELELARGSHSLFVGREEEVEAIRILARVARDLRRPYLITILGEPGVGKTRLMEEAGKQLEREGCVVLWGRVPPYGAVSRLFPLIEMTRQLCGISDADGQEEATRKVIATVRAIFGEQSPPSEGFTQRLLEGLGLEGAAESQSIRDAAAPFLVLIQAASAKVPVVLVFDDVHWADDDLLEVIDRLSLDTASSALVVCALARPQLLERVPTWGGGRRQSHISELAPLPEAETGRLVEDLMGGNCSEELVRLVVERSGGNPLFVSELTAYLRSSGLVFQEDGVFKVKTGEIEELPLGLRAVIGARLDSLPVAARQVLQVASVIGDQFSAEALQAVYGDDGDGAENVGRQLRILVDEGLLDAANDSGDLARAVYRFRHGLVREAAYRLLPRVSRSKLHSRVAEFLEARLQRMDLVASESVDSLGLPASLGYDPGFVVGTSGQLGGYPIEEIAYQYEKAAKLADPTEQAKARERAFEFLVQSGHRAAGLAMFREAKRLYERAHSLAPPSASSLEGLAYANFCLGLLGEAEQIVKQAIDLAREEGDPKTEARALVTLGEVLHRKGQTEEAVALTEAAEDLWQRAGEAGGVLKARLSRAEMLVFGNSPLEGAEVAREAAEAARTLGNGYLEATALQLVGVAHYLMGETVEARRHFEDALVKATSVRSLPGVGGAIVGLGWLDLWEGCLQEVAQTGENILRLAREGGELRGEGFAATLAGAAYLELGRCRQAAELCRRGVEVLAKLQDRWGEAMARFYLGLSLGALGHVGDAEKHLYSSYSLSLTVGNHTLAGAALVFLGDLYRAVGRLEEAVLRLREGSKLLSGGMSGESPWRLQLARVTASLAEAAGEYSTAERIRTAALAKVKGSGEDRALAVKPLMLEHARSLVFSGDLEEAERTFSEASALSTQDAESQVLESIVRGEIAAALGDGESAVEILKEAFSASCKRENVYLVKMAGDALRDFYVATGDSDHADEVAETSRRVIENIESLL
jgi:class 3 adenylate cyclase/tetratricopeptide (TPR) repeat protein